MNKSLAIIFMVTLLILTQNLASSFAKTSSNNTVLVQESDKEDEEHQINITDDNNDHAGIRVIAIIPGSTTSANTKSLTTPTHTVNLQPVAATTRVLPTASLTPTPTLTQNKTLSYVAYPQTATANTNTSIETSPTPTTQVPQISHQDTQNETSTQTFYFIKELGKLLSFLKKIIFTAIS